ncbi:MAG: hypothetical protein BWY24_00819 [Microgenomates group bacterium ADurb.Bin219]|nr:MAG: hypothetical protein BWY24_00819 [Microgenomates group bacterium ADurb.Bin219]HNP89435.1 hypothetical protein [Candidatus Woesebacteria bacterium]
MSESSNGQNEIVSFPVYTEGGGLQIIPKAVKTIESPKIPEAPQLINQFAELAAASLAYARKKTESNREHLADSGSRAIKKIVGQGVEIIKTGDPENALNFLYNCLEQYRIRVCVPLSASELNPSEAGNFAGLYLSLLNEAKHPGQKQKDNPQLREFEKKVIQSSTYREKFERLKQSVEGHLEEFSQGALAELIFFNLSLQAGLNPEFSSPHRDTKGHIDYFIHPRGKEIKIQVKSNKYLGEPEIKKLSDGRWLVVVGAPPLDLNDSRVAEYYRRILFPKKEEAEKFGRSFETANSQPEQPYIPARFRVKVPA